MRVTFGTIVLNEALFLPTSLEQHLRFCDEWIIVEGADRRWPGTHATSNGLSVDATAQIIRDFPDPERKINFVQHGWANDKSELRNQYADRVTGDVLIVVDADEFLSRESFHRLLNMLARLRSPGTVRIPHLHLWKSDEHIVVGNYWNVPHDRAYRWLPGCRYGADHNHPVTPNGQLLRDLACSNVERKLQHVRGVWTHDEPFWLHYGFARAPDEVSAKNAYYLARGEARTRPDTTRDRAAWFAEQIPTGAQLLRWAGPFPEICPKV